MKRLTITRDERRKMMKRLTITRDERRKMMKRLTILGFIACLGLLFAPAAAIGESAGAVPVHIQLYDDTKRTNLSYTVPEGKRLKITHVSMRVTSRNDRVDNFCGVVYSLKLGESFGDVPSPVAFLAPFVGPFDPLSRMPANAHKFHAYVYSAPMAMEVDEMDIISFKLKNSQAGTMVNRVIVSIIGVLDTL